MDFWNDHIMSIRQRKWKMNIQKNVIVLKFYKKKSIIKGGTLKYDALKFSQYKKFPFNFLKCYDFHHFLWFFHFILQILNFHMDFFYWSHLYGYL
jgi:hypothetical protein